MLRLPMSPLITLRLSVITWGKEKGKTGKYSYISVNVSCAPNLEMAGLFGFKNTSSAVDKAAEITNQNVLYLTD